jgi:hypothetical protein
MQAHAMTLPVLAASAWFEEPPDLPAPLGNVEFAYGKPVLDFLEPAQRRRLSRLARGVFHCAGQVGPPGDARVVFASRHGEAERTLSILEDLAAGAEVSPLLFSMSVHNAVPGLLSILRGNRAPSTALAAGSETFGYGLMEACALWRGDPSKPVLFLYGEDRLPELWAPFVPAEVPHALAMLIGEGGRELTLTWDPSGRGPEPALTQTLHFLGGGRGPWSGPSGSWDWHLA